MNDVRCPGCVALTEVRADTRSADLLECANRAGQSFRLRRDPHGWSATPAYRVSCPACGEVTTLPVDAEPGDTVRCCGRPYRLTFEYGAFAEET